MFPEKMTEFEAVRKFVADNMLMIRRETSSYYIDIHDSETLAIGDIQETWDSDIQKIECGKCSFSISCEGYSETHQLSVIINHVKSHHDKEIAEIIKAYDRFIKDSRGN